MKLPWTAILTKPETRIGVDNSPSHQQTYISIVDNVYAGSAPSVRRQKSKAVTRRIMKVLLDAEVNLRCHHRSVSKRKLYLFEWCQADVREPREGPPQIVRAGHDVELVRISLHDCEHALGREPPRREVPVARDTSENSSLRDASRIFPAGDGGVRPQRNRHTPNPAHFASQVDDDPAAISLLNVLAVQARQLRPAQARAEENGKHRDVAVSLERLQIRKCQELFCLFYR